MENKLPSEQLARIVAQDLGHSSINHLQRFTTGKAHYVYDVKTAEDDFVIRLTKPEQVDSFKSTIYWYQRLKPLGLPLPTIRSYDIEGRQYGYPLIVMDRLPGSDLAHVYDQLSSDQKKDLAVRIVDIQKRVGQLPLATGFGYARSYEDPKLFSSWQGVMDLYLDRINLRNQKTSLIDPKYINRLANLINSNQEYIKSIKPIPFLDDITTKNVIIENGKLSGIVDFDYICFGDPLLTLGLTRMSLLDMKADTIYTDHWESLLNLIPDQSAFLDIYTGLFALEFASAMGQTFNSEEAEPIDQVRLNHLLEIFEKLMANK